MLNQESKVNNSISNLWVTRTQQGSHFGHHWNPVSWTLSAFMPQVPGYRALPNIFEKSKVHNLFDKATKTAISASYAIFLARKDHHWPTDKPLLLLSWIAPCFLEQIFLSCSTLFNYTYCISFFFSVHWPFSKHMPLLKYVLLLS